MKLRNTIDMLTDLTYVDKLDVSQMLNLIRTICQDGLMSYMDGDQDKEASPSEALILQMPVGDREKAGEDFAWLARAFGHIGSQLGIDFAGYDDSNSGKTELVSVKNELEKELSDLDKTKEELHDQIDNLERNIHNSKLMIQTMEDDIHVKAMDMDDAQKKIMELAKAHSALN